MISERIQVLLAGSVLCGVVLLIVSAIVICFLCWRRKHHKKREQKKFRPLSPHVSPTHSKPSTLGNMTNGSLPKVSSSGLWMDTPGVYAVPPPQHYYYERPHGYGMHDSEHPYPIPRAISETRIPQPGLPYVPPYRPQFGSQNNMVLLPLPAQRFYHSQQLTPVYELHAPTGMEIYDYPFSGEAGGFRSKLLETRHTPNYYNNNSEFVLKARVERARSDAENKRASKPQPKKEPSKQKSSLSQQNGSRPAFKDNKSSQSSWMDDDRKLPKSSKGSAGVQKATTENIHGAHFNNGFSSDSALVYSTATPSKALASTTITVTNLSLPNDNAGMVSTTTRSSSDNSSPSATDSMKLLANNKTDDQKTQPAFIPLKVDNNVNRIDETDTEFNIRHYTYEGSIYAVSNKNINDTDYDNPIINRLKEMAVEKSRYSNISAPKNDWSNPYEIIMSNEHIKTSTADSGIVHEVSHVKKMTTTKVSESIETLGVSGKNPTALQMSNNSIDVVDGLVLPDILVLEDDNNISTVPPVSIQPESSKRSLAATTNRNHITDSSTLVAELGRDVLSPIPRQNVDADGGTDDLNKAGKQITTSAFQFLDNYLSDDEGTESLIESPPQSPGGLRGREVY